MLTHDATHDDSIAAATFLASTERSKRHSNMYLLKLPSNLLQYVLQRSKLALHVGFYSYARTLM